CTCVCVCVCVCVCSDHLVLLAALLSYEAQLLLQRALLHVQLVQGLLHLLPLRLQGLQLRSLLLLIHCSKQSTHTHTHKHTLSPHPLLQAVHTHTLSSSPSTATRHPHTHPHHHTTTPR